MAKCSECGQQVPNSVWVCEVQLYGNSEWGPYIVELRKDALEARESKIKHNSGVKNYSFVEYIRKL